MKLRQPTDFLILEALQLYGRNVAPNLAEHIDKSRKNINTRLPVLLDYGLVDKVGPSNNSGLYEITDKGVVVLQHRDAYNDVEDFDSLIERRLEESEGVASQEVFVRGSTNVEDRE
ncbi:MAG: winged helix-turn-helix domain-containing protein [Halobacteriota archaeon]